MNSKRYHLPSGMHGQFYLYARSRGPNVMHYNTFGIPIYGVNGAYVFYANPKGVLISFELL